VGIWNHDPMLLRRMRWPQSKAELIENVISFHTPGANSTSVSYNASAVKFYIAKSSLVRFKNENSFFYLEKTI
jgi:hypothetical protein